MKRNVIFCLFVFIHTITWGQTKDMVTIVPGSNFLRGYKIKDYKIKYDFISYKDGIEKKVGQLEDQFIVMTNSHGKLGLRVCNITFGSNKILDSGLCFLKGLKPIYHRSIQTKKKMTLDFNNEFVNGKILFSTAKGDSSEKIKYSSNTILFDSYYEDIIAKSIRFKKGLVFKFPEYIYERGGLVWSTGQVLDKLKIPNKNGEIDLAWKVQFFEMDFDGKIIRTTTYIIKENNREIISREYKTKNSLIVMRQSEA